MPLSSDGTFNSGAKSGAGAGRGERGRDVTTSSTARSGVVAVDTWNNISDF